MTTQKPQKALVDLISEKTIRKLEAQQEFEKDNIEALKKLAKLDSLTKSQLIIEAIKLKSSGQNNETVNT